MKRLSATLHGQALCLVSGLVCQPADPSVVQVRSANLFLTVPVTIYRRDNPCVSPLLG